MISTRDLTRLPDVDDLRRLLQSMALLDAVLCPEWENRYYSFNAEWAIGEQMGSMRNGSGDHFYAHFGPAGCWLKGFAHEYAMTSYREFPPRPWPGIYESIPAEFAGCVREPAFETQSVTFCIWRRHRDNCWQVGPVDFPPDDPDPDGSKWLLSELDGRPETYRSFAADYYERDVSLTAIEHVYRHRPLAREVIARMNPEVSPDDLAADIREIGCPRPQRSA